jgi:hypothetical protein
MRPLECIQLAGGLGNQLFQFTAGIARSLHNGTQISFDVSRIDHGVTIRGESISDVVKVISKEEVHFNFVESKLPRLYDVATHRFNVVKQIDDFLRPSFNSSVTGFDEGIYTQHRVAVIRGYFQSWKYLDYLNSQNVHLELKREETQSKITPYLQDFDFENDIAIHVRRGDYSRFRDSIGLLSFNYYVDAIREIGPDRRVIVFSDDIEISREFPTSMDFSYTPELTLGKAVDSLFLMLKFRNLVISNSTFSWWAAALGRSDKNIIAPDKWFRCLEDPLDLVMPKWGSIKSDWMK